ncbi:MAG: IclR family transcriptional regulator [Nocardioidaceae bacterium]
MSELLRRAVDVLDTMARSERDLSIRDIAESTATSKSSVQRILSSLLATGLAVQEPTSRRYGLGPRTLVLGTAYQKKIDLRSIALPHMARLRDATGETVGLSVAVGDELLHIEQVESASELRRSFEVGRTLPLWCGAPSRVLLADLCDEQVERIVRGRRPSAVVPAAPPTADELIASVRACRDAGYGAAYGETIAGVNTVAAPLRGADGRTVATISITGPAMRLDEAAFARMVPVLLSTAEDVSRLLGHRV